MAPDFNLSTIREDVLLAIGRTWSIGDLSAIEWLLAELSDAATEREMFLIEKERELP
jgi:hypothetical protein